MCVREEGSTVSRERDSVVQAITLLFVFAIFALWLYLELGRWPERTFIQAIFTSLSLSFIFCWKVPNVPAVITCFYFLHLLV